MDQYTAVEDQLAPPSECNVLKPAVVEDQRAMDAVAIANTLKPYPRSRNGPCTCDLRDRVNRRGGSADCSPIPFYEHGCFAPCEIR